jgi:hypothetical protein
MNAMPAIVGGPSSSRGGAIETRGGGPQEEDGDLEDPMAAYIRNERVRPASFPSSSPLILSLFLLSLLRPSSSAPLGLSRVGIAETIVIRCSLAATRSPRRLDLNPYFLPCHQAEEGQEAAQVGQGQEGEEGQERQEGREASSRSRLEGTIGRPVRRRRQGEEQTAEIALSLAAGEEAGRGGEVRWWWRGEGEG